MELDGGSVVDVEKPCRSDDQQKLSAALQRLSGGRGGAAIVAAEVPLVELFGFNDALRSVSQGRRQPR